MSAPSPSPIRRALTVAGNTLWRVTLDVMRRHATFAITVGLLAIYAAKSIWYGDFFNPHLHPGIPDVPFLNFISRDLLAFGAALALLAALENLIRHWTLRVLTIALSVVLAFLSVCNAFWLANTGLQLNLSVIRAALTRLDDAMPIIVKSVQLWGLVLLLVAVGAMVGLPFVFRARWSKERPHPRSHRWYSVGLGLVLMLWGGLCLALEGKPQITGLRLTAGNLYAGLVRDLRDPLQQAPMRDKLPPRPPDPLVTQQPKLEQPPNVVEVMLEATSHGASSFAGPKIKSTPFLVQLAQHGLYASHMRSVLPHTSKSIFSFMCGTYPAMQTAVLETADNYGMRCLPHLLGRHGYSSALIQSADGSFEDRPRLAHNLGFDHFMAWPEQTTPELGYLASDDRALIEPAMRWMAAQKRQNKPFFLLLVTSVTHHTYRPPKWHPDSARIDKLPPQQRYLWLVSYLDFVLKQLWGEMQRAGLLDNTILLAHGDHGEGFGEHGLYQHDNTYFEEGLRVPFVLVDPRRIPTPRVVPENRTLMDVTPTVLELVGIPFRKRAFDGRSLLHPVPRDARHYFACWYDNTCVGYVQGDYKRVFLPAAQSWVRFDLKRDPQERKPVIEAPEDHAQVKLLSQWLTRRRYAVGSARFNKTSLFGDRWRCGKTTLCQLDKKYDKGSKASAEHTQP